MKPSIEDCYELLTILKTIKKRPIRDLGICSNVLLRVKNTNESFLRKRDFLDLVSTAASTWPEYSGNPSYPIHTSRIQSPTKQYINTWFYWSCLTSYGRARRRLLAFLINHFEQLVKQDVTD